MGALTRGACAQLTGPPGARVALDLNLELNPTVSLRTADGPPRRAHGAGPKPRAEPNPKPARS